MCTYVAFFVLREKSVILQRKSIICNKETRKESENAREIRIKCIFSDFRAEQKRSQAELSQAKNPLARALALASSAWTHH